MFSFAILWTCLLLCVFLYLLITTVQGNAAQYGLVTTSGILSKLGRKAPTNSSHFSWYRDSCDPAESTNGEESEKTSGSVRPTFLR